MVITPKMRGYICTTAHPAGCAQNVKDAVAYVTAHKNHNSPKRVLIIGSSTGYGLACQITAAFGNNAETIGVFFEKGSSDKRTATAGFYNQRAFEKLADYAGLLHFSINGDAFSDAVKNEVIQTIRHYFSGGKVDLVIYSLAAPKRLDPAGVLHSSTIQPIDEAYTSKTVDFHTGEVTEITIPSATPEEIAGTTAVMGGEDWLLWMNALNEAHVLAKHACTVAFSYLGPELTHPIYKNGTIGKAKEDLEIKAQEISKLLEPLGGKAFVSVNKALVTQASSAIPVVPLYISLLYKVMKAHGTHEQCTEQAVRLFERLYPSPRATWDAVLTDAEGRIRLDDWEMQPEIQSEVMQLWEQVTSENISQLSDLEGYRKDFYNLFGFEVPGVDYEQDVNLHG